MIEEEDQGIEELARVSERGGEREMQWWMEIDGASKGAACVEAGLRRRRRTATLTLSSRPGLEVGP